MRFLLGLVLLTLVLPGLAGCASKPALSDKEQLEANFKQVLDTMKRTTDDLSCESEAATYTRDLDQYVTHLTSISDASFEKLIPQIIQNGDELGAEVARIATLLNSKAFFMDSALNEPAKARYGAYNKRVNDAVSKLGGLEKIKGE